MSRYNIYPECHESGIAWLNKLPTHWELARFKNIFKIQKRIAGTLGHDVLSITQKGVKIKDTESGDGQLSMDYSKYQIVKKDDFAMNHMDLLTGYVDISKFDGVTSPDYRVFTINEQKHHPRYFLYLLQLCYIAKIFYPLGQGAAQIGRWRLPTEAFNEFVTPVPTYREQQLIATFLDQETAKIDALIEKQQRLIELLKEKRQAVISHAVTKGLNPNAPMKDSGVEWLGEVPAHWRITQIKYVAELNPRKALIELKPSLECNFVPMEKLKTESLLLDEIRTVEEVISGYTCFCDEDILMAKVTPCFENRNIAIARGLKNGVGFGSTEIYVLRTVKHVSNSFLLFRLQENEFMRMATGAMTGAGGLKRVPTDFVNSFKFAIPPIPEQLEICSFIEKQKKRYDSLESLARNQVELLQKRRTALISAAVTGKIDVRDWQAAA